MKLPVLPVVALLIALPHLAAATRLATVAQAHPMVKLVTLLEDLQAKLEADGETEQKAYEKYACWCEDTLVTKANEISTAKDEIDKLQTSVKELKGAVAAHAVDIKQLKKDIARNVESTQEATEIREKEATEYQESKSESEQCIGALEAAIGVLTGAGEGEKKRGFLETLQEAQLLSVVAGVRSVLRRPVVSRTVSEKQLQLMRQFLDRPEDFVGGSTNMLSAVQIANNPFGDYAPPSTQIQGILKGMYDAFTSDLEKSNAEEAQKQKGFEDLMKTKKAELAALEATLEKQEMDKAEKTKTLADSKSALDDTKTQLEDGEAFFSETKSSCQEKASQWAMRTRLRTEELHGVGTAIKILTSEKAVKTFENATSSFLQLSDISQGTDGERAASAYRRVRALATRYNSLQLGQLAAMIRTAGHFTKVIHAIEKMIAILHEDQQQDIKERDICEKKQLKNKHDMEDLNFDIEKAEDKIKILKNKGEELEDKVESLEKEVEATEKEIQEMIGIRTQEQTAYLRSVQDDLDAIRLLDKAIVALTRFYKSNKIPLSFAQSKEERGAATPGKPELGWKDGNYGGRTGESGGIISILKMIKEDFEQEIETGKMQDSAAGVNFNKDKEALEEGLSNTQEMLVNTKKELADVNAKLVDTNEYKNQKDKDLGVQEEIKETLTKNCAWVETHFASREEARNAEIAGLIEAKHYLKGMQ